MHQKRAAADWREWVDKATTGHCAAGHAYSRHTDPPQQDPLGSRSAAPASANEEVLDESAAWGPLWKSDEEPADIHWPDAACTRLPALSVCNLKQAAQRFKVKTGLGVDKLHPRSLLHIDDAHLESLARLYEKVETDGLGPLLEMDYHPFDPEEVRRPSAGWRHGHSHACLGKCAQRSSQTVGAQAGQAFLVGSNWASL